MNVIMTGSGKFVEVQGTAEQKAFSKDDMGSMITLAEKGVMELIAHQEKALKGRG